MKKFNPTLLGFTLIELLLIIAILSTILTLFISSYQQRTTNLKVQKTALQMQEILQAANVFYQANQNWPTRDDTNFKNNYLPVGLQNNPWGTSYSYVFVNDDFRIYSGLLPNRQLANRIVSLLPNALLDPITHSQVILLNQLPQSNVYNIKTIGYTPSLCDATYGSGCQKTYTFSMNCAVGTTPQVIVYPLFIDADYVSDDYAGSNEISTLDTTPVSCTTPDNQGNTQCTIQVFLSSSHGYAYHHSPHNLGSGIFSYIGYCYNPAAVTPTPRNILF